MRFFVTLSLVLLALLGAAQKKCLIIESKTDQKQVVLEEGNWVKVTYHNGEVFKGVLHVENDSVISVGSVKMFLKGVQSIKTKTFGANMFRAMVISTAFFVYLSASVFVVAYIIAVVVSFFYIESPHSVPANDLKFLDSITGWINDLYNMANRLELFFPSDKFVYKVSAVSSPVKD